MSNFITALDIGSSQIKTIVAEIKKDGSFSLINSFKCPSAGIKRGAVVDSEEATLSIMEVAIELRKISKNCVKDVFVNVNNEHINCRHSRGMVVVSRADQEIQKDDKERVDQNAKALRVTPNYMVLHNIVRDYLIDEIGDIADPVGMTGNRLEVSTLVIEAFSPKTNLLIKTLERAGIRIGGLFFNPLAASEAVLTKRQKDLGVALLDFGFGTTSLAVFDENKVSHVKTIPIGMSHVINDIAVGFKVPVDVADKLRALYGYALAKEIPRRETIKLSEVESSLKDSEISRKFLAEIIEIRLAEILDFVNNELKSLGRSQLAGGVVITGGGSKLAGLTDLTEKELNRPTQIGFPNLSGFEISNPSYEDMIDDPEFSVAVGLALLGSDERGGSYTGPIEWLKKVLSNLIP